LRASHLDAPGRRLRRPVLPPVPGSDCRTRRSSIFGRPVDVTGPTPRFSGASSRASSGNQPVKVLALKINTSDKRKPSLAGRETPGFDTLASRHRSSSTIYKAKPPGLSSALISARVSNC